MVQLDHERPTGFLGSEQNRQRRKGEFCDVILTIGARQFHAHRSVLAACSPYFRTMFSNDLLERGKKPIPMDASIPQEGVLETLLDYFYVGRITVNGANAQSLLAASSLLLLSELKADCCKVLKGELWSGNCLGIALLADHYSCDDLHKTALQFALNNFESVAEEDEFLQLCLNDAEKLLKSDRLAAKSEEAVFSAAMRWIRHDETNRKVHLAEILGAVRLTLCTEEFLVTAIDEDRLLLQCSEECRRAFADAVRAKNMQGSSSPLDQPRSPASPRQALCIVTGTSRDGVASVEQAEPLVAHGQTFSVISTIIAQRHSFAIATLTDRIFVLGGWNNAAAGGIHFLATMDCYNASDDQWTASLAPMSTGRERHCAAVLDGHLYAIGGWDASGVTASVERYDPANNSWQNMPPMQIARKECAAVALGDAIYVLGGKTDIDVLSSVERFDINSASWTTVTPMRTPRVYFGCAVFNGKIFIAGGCDGRDRAAHAYAPLSSVECFDPIAQQWFDKGSLVEARFKLGLAVIDGRLLAIGGRSERSNRLENFEEYVLETDSWRRLCEFEISIFDHYVGVVRALSAE